MTLNPIHFEEESEVVSEKVVEKSKGRPKKGKKSLEIGNEEGEEDLLNTLLVAAKEKEAPEDKQKEAERKKKEEEKEAKEAEKKKKEAERKQKEEEKEAERKKKEQEKEAEQKKKEQEKKKKEQEKKEQEKEAEQKKKEPEEEEASAEVSKVKRFTYTDGLVYLKSATGIVYNSDHDEIGKWNNLTKTIEFNVEKEDRELSEDEYEEEEELEDLKNDEEEEDDE